MEKRSDKYKTSKLKVILIILITIVVLIGCLFAWSRYVSTSGLSVNENKIVDSKLPTSFNGLKVVHFSDVLYGSTIDKKKLNKVISQINLINPDLVLFTGDLINPELDINDKVIKDLTDSLSNINSRYGKYAVKGDNDYESDSYLEIMQNSNFTILNNSYDLVYNEKNEFIYLGGISSRLKKENDVSKTLEYFNDENISHDIYSIVMMHEANTIDELKNKDQINLALAGHTLGGQVRLPIVGGIINDRLNKYDKEYYKINDIDFYISYGLGTLDYPFRLLNRPSINFYRIYNK